MALTTRQLYYQQNKEYIKARVKSNRDSKINYYREYEKARHLKRKYGITRDVYNKMLQDQEGKCAICLRDQETFKYELCVDHCHTTGKIRQLLCNSCNRMLGLKQEDPKAFLRAYEYLKKWR